MMFGKKKCSRCERKVNRSFGYCPHCANPLDKKEDYGMLGRTDDIGEINKMVQKDMGSIMGSPIIEKMLSGAIKMIEKEIQKGISQENQERKNMPSQSMPSNFELYINGKKVNLPGNIAGIQIEKMPGNKAPQPKIHPNSKIPKVSSELIEKSSKLPRREAKSRVARTSDRVIYELETPGLFSLNNVLVNRLENSIEIKAYTEKAVYFKALPVKLPLIQYSIKPEGKLILEFKAQ